MCFFKVLGMYNFGTNLAKGGKTATAINPKGTRAKDKGKVVIAVLVGKPPPAIDPTGKDPPAVPLA